MRKYGCIKKESQGQCWVFIGLDGKLREATEEEADILDDRDGIVVSREMWQFVDYYDECVFCYKPGAYSHIEDLVTCDHCFFVLANMA